MSISFENSPLIELVAEFRWVPPNSLVPAPGVLNIGTISVPVAANEVFFNAFANASARLGFTQAERLVPQGFPTVIHSVVYRLRRTDGGGELLQVGPGVFSANNMRPYHSWHNFVDTVRSGVEIALTTRPENERELPLTQVTLRYINAFNADLMGGRSPNEFIRDVLGFRIKLPTALQALNSDPARTASNLQFIIPIGESTKQLKVGVGDGISPGGAPATLLDWSVVETTAIPPEVDAVMHAFNSSRDVMHNAFLEMTSPIRDAMRPREQANA